MTAKSQKAQRLVLISGPIASGKTTVAMKLAEAARGRGQRAAVIDMDQLVEMVAGDWSKVQYGDRDRAIDVAAAIVDRLVESDTEVIAVAGSTVAAYEWRLLLDCLTAKPSILFVLLRVSLEESVRRAQADPARRPTARTRDARFVSRMYAHIDWDSLPPRDLDLTTDTLSVDEVVEAIDRALFGL